MNFKKILHDAEDLKTKKSSYFDSQKLKNKFPKYQYMGIIKLNKIEFLKLKKFFKLLNNKKIDFTTFLIELFKKK